MRQSDVWQCVLEEERDAVHLLGWKAVEGVAPHLMAILGVDAVCQSEKRFCETSHCPPENLRAFLGQKWSRHHVGKVARLEEAAGRFPLLLIRGCGPIYSLEIWSPKDPGDALVEVPAIREITHDDMARLSKILDGPDHASMCEEADFCVETGCPPGELEDWLRAYWIDYDISSVLAGSEKVAPNPIVLVKQYDDFFTARLFSPSEELPECSERDQEEGQISELNRLYLETQETDEDLA